jgi:Ala-tRNA(Pro) deacylase
MIPESILRYLNRADVSFTRRWHPRAVGGQEVAASLHITGRRVTKCVVVDADGERLIAVVPVASRVDTRLLAEGLGRERVTPLPETELAAMFPDCELGAEPPLGRLYNLQVVVDSNYALGKQILFRAGSHEETLEMAFSDYETLEAPRLLPFARPLGVLPAPPRQVRA